LGSTEEGRGWIALFERVRTPLLTPVLENPDLAGRAARLVAAAGAQVADDSAVLAREIAGEARDFVNALAERGPAELRRELRIAQDRLGTFAGLSTAEIMRALMGRGPGNGSGPVRCVS
jgi:hypothetical protein